MHAVRAAAIKKAAMGGELNFSNYLRTAAATASLAGVLTAVAVAMIDPFGLAPIAVTIPAFNTTKVARNTSDRLIKPYDVIALRPKTVIIGTSRVKQAFDPDFVTGSFAPAYNAGVDALHVSEARQLLAHYLRSGLPIEHVFMEIFPMQFGIFNVWAKPVEIVVHPIVDRVAAMFAVREAIETVAASRAGHEIATRRDGLRPLGIPHGGPGFVSPDWLSAVARMQLAPSLDDQAFRELDAIVDLCAAHGVDLKLFIGPLHPVFAYMFWSKNKRVLHEWLARIGSRPNVTSFLTAAEFRERELDRAKPYYSDSSHVTFAAAKLMTADLMASPKLMRHGRVLDRASLPAILAQWEDQLAAWADVNPQFVQQYRALAIEGDDNVPRAGGAELATQPRKPEPATPIRGERAESPPGGG
jgi:hypothetical protein